MRLDKHLAFLKKCEDKDLDELVEIFNGKDDYSYLDKSDKFQFILSHFFSNMDVSTYKCNSYEDTVNYINKHFSADYYSKYNYSDPILYKELKIVKEFLQQNLNKNRSEVIDVLDIRSTDDEAFIDRAFSERNLQKTFSFLYNKAILQSQVEHKNSFFSNIFPFIIKVASLRLSIEDVATEAPQEKGEFAFLYDTEKEYLYFFKELFHFIEDEYEHTAENWEDVEQHLNHYLPLLAGVSFYSDLVKGVAEYLNIEVDNSLPTEQVEREIVRYYFTQLYGYIENNNEIIEYLSISNPQISDTEKGSKVREFIARVFTTRTTDNDAFSANTPYSDLAYDIPRLDKNINMEIVICSILVVSYLRLKNSRE